jgi:hypothetical protein
MGTGAVSERGLGVDSRAVPGAAAGAAGHVEYELRFESLFDPGRALTFPCDERGVVNLDGLSERGRHNYFCARAGVGRDFAPATLQRCGPRAAG